MPNKFGIYSKNDELQGKDLTVNAETSNIPVRVLEGSRITVYMVY